MMMGCEAVTGFNPQVQDHGGQEADEDGFGIRAEAREALEKISLDLVSIDVAKNEASPGKAAWHVVLTNVLRYGGNRVQSYVRADGDDKTPT